ncbi:LLM class flavin-dependent oxidoreductase [Nocardia sp. 2]|uniref:LLM class flavin-dependent oxidoreductase n=1 Tax=Nocardia acididurans TaxID=2802282 RepID=A0ABS1M289_9NOCA|nr:LLM class flavin-dependent oxidoreductase [Nocardia acididurans]MBL1074190.1 LLM class flavin-dependent oxidoreductase [Nocardia acididurans]
MSDPLLSVSLPYWQDRDPMDALLVAEAAEDLGYDRLWLGEMATFDALALATAIGRTPGRMPMCIGPLAVNVRTPMTIAMGIASVAALTDRTVSVALGTSSDVVVHDWHGRERNRATAHLEESTRIVRTLLSGAKANFEGVAQRSHGYRLRLPVPRPGPGDSDSAALRAGMSPHAADTSMCERPEAVSAVRPPTIDVHRSADACEIAVAAFGARALAVAGRFGDRAVLNLVTPQQVSRCAEAIAESAWAAGRPTPPVSVWVTAAADPTAEEWATARRGVVAYLRAPGYDAMFRAAGFADIVDAAHHGTHPRELLAAVPDALVAAVGMFGDAATLATRLAAFRAAGADEVVVVPLTSPGDPAGRRTLATLAALPREETSDPSDRSESLAGKLP